MQWLMTFCGAISKDERLISSREITRTNLVPSVPAILEMPPHTLVGFADTAMVGRLAEGGAAVAGTSLGNNVFMFALTIFAAIGTGSTALVARSIGAGDNRTADRVVVQSLLVGSVLAILLTLAGTLFAEQAMDFMGAEGLAHEYGAVYLRIIAHGAMPTFVMQILTGFEGSRRYQDTNDHQQRCQPGQYRSQLGLDLWKPWRPALGVAGCHSNQCLSSAGCRYPVVIAWDAQAQADPWTAQRRFS